MPPKRKATAAQLSEEPPVARRRTRAIAVAQSSKSADILTDHPQKHRARTRQAIVAVQEESQPTQDKRRTRSNGSSRPPIEAESRRKLPDADDSLPMASRQTRAKGPPVQRTKAKSQTNVLRSVDGSDRGADDELPLSPPSKSRPPVHHTPPPRTRSTRVIMHSVEIASPRFRTNGTLLHPMTVSPTRKHVREKTPTTEAVPPPLTPTPAVRHRQSPPLSQTPKQRVKRALNATPHASPSRLPTTLPEHLHPCLHAQKRAVLALLQNPSMNVASEDEDDACANDIAAFQLKELIAGTVDRGEGNSCLLIGPRGSGKTRLLEDTISALSVQPIVIRLSGYAQNDDSLALREIASQLAQQTSDTYTLEADGEGEVDENPFAPSIPLPPPSHLPTLISTLPSLARPTIVVLEAFDLFALHGRQALLYCLLDTAQSCRASESTKGITVIGVTTRVDTLNLLEKRVKSRFSGRMIRTAGPRDIDDWLAIARVALTASIEEPDDEWSAMWPKAVERFLADRAVKEVFLDTFGLMKDVRMLSQILVGPIASLLPQDPFPTAAHLSASVGAQRCPPIFPFLSASSYPEICLLIAAIHASTGGHDVVTFEMLHDSFRTQLRTSLSAPVQVDGGGIGMVRCSREVLMAAFEHLISSKVFLPAAGASSHVRPEFVRHKCMVGRDDVKRAVEAIGQTNLKKWFSRAQ